MCGHTYKNKVSDQCVSVPVFVVVVVVHELMIFTVRGMSFMSSSQCLFGGWLIHSSFTCCCYPKTYLFRRRRLYPVSPLEASLLHSWQCPATSEFHESCNMGSSKEKYRRSI